MVHRHCRCTVASIHITSLNTHRTAYHFNMNTQLSSRVAEVILNVETQTVTSEAESQLISPSLSQTTSDTPSTSNTPTSAPTVPTDDRIFNVPQRCFGLKKHKTKGLVECKKAPESEFHFAFCGKTHKQQFSFAVHHQLHDLFYFLVGFINTRKPDLLDEFLAEVVPHVSLSIARSLRQPLYQSFKSVEECLEFAHNTKENTLGKFKAFYLKVKDEFRPYLLDIAVVTGAGDPDELFRKWDLFFDTVNQLRLHEVRCRYYIVE